MSVRGSTPSPLRSASPLPMGSPPRPSPLGGMASGTDPISPSSDSSRIPPPCPALFHAHLGHLQYPPAAQNRLSSQKSQENNSPRRQPAVKQGTAAQCDPSHRARDILGNKVHQARGIYPIHLCERQTDRRCICLAHPEPAACPVGVEGRYRLQPLDVIFFLVAHVTSPPPMSPSPPSRYQTNLQICRVPACLPPNIRPAPPHLTAAALPKSVQTPMHDAILPFSSRASRACVSDLFTVQGGLTYPSLAFHPPFSPGLSLTRCGSTHTPPTEQPPPPPANPPLDKPPPTEYTPTLNPYRSPPGYLRRFLRNRHPSPRHPRAIATAYSAFLSLSESISRCLPQSGQKTSSMLPSQSVLPPVCRSRGVGSELTNGTATFIATWHAIQSVPY